MEIKIPFNKPFMTGKEKDYIEESVKSGKISGDGMFTRRVHTWFEKKYGFPKCLLTTSCTDALEMCALLLDIAPGDEVILPSYTFVSTANPFVLRGANLVFADSEPNHPNIDVASLEGLITPKTKAIVVVHYAGIACDMDALQALVEKHDLFLVEDAAQAIDAFYKGKPLGSFGHLSTFSFHETKNVISGEGGMLVINDERFFNRAEIIREKGTNRSAFFRGEVDKYGWVDMGSSFLPSDILAAFLFAQLENIEDIQKQRLHLWHRYHEALQGLEEGGHLQRPTVPEHREQNAHMYYILLPSLDVRSALAKHLKSRGILAVFHYQSLHRSEFFLKHYQGGPLPQTDRYTDCLLRLPLYYELSDEEQQQVIQALLDFFTS
ncbi:MAG TPA: dTDP-4-amino-4,6-dideoxygalactose transaminase [Cytophagales bacterium]|nr:dTDP-4-amino-4,6-dideoxygalactose transaminase [Cytophagales bacterium]HAA19577.1 dTDP-4-amino-4,6-dideoxygalactose transaminase [Cytophagales bacterium]HAP58752.1 dTDP-4-amino-4,6-dideoxygalactose transaminase [Cytophagales bacterium]